MTIDTSGALELAQQILAARAEQTENEAQRKKLDERNAVIAAQLRELDEKFARLLVNGASPAAAPAASKFDAPPQDNAEHRENDEDDEDEDDDDTSDEVNESQRAQVLAFYKSQPGKWVPLPIAIDKLSDISAKSVRSYTSKLARNGGPLKRVRRGVYKYVGRPEE